MISFKEFINEVFDNPWDKEHDEHMTNEMQHFLSNHKEPHESFNNVKAHKLEGDNGHLISYTRNGVLEVHHLDKDQNSGEIQNGNKPNPRFYSTMIEHLKTHGLDKGRPVKVVSTKDSVLSKHYKNIIPKITKREGYEIEHGEDSSLGNKVDTITIHPKGYNKKFDGLKEQLKNIFDI
jgi:hypothetical protein